MVLIKNVQKYALEMENPLVTTVTELNEGEAYENFIMWFISSLAQSTSNAKIT